jgi:hypothetical protein
MHLKQGTFPSNIPEDGGSPLALAVFCSYNRKINRICLDDRGDNMTEISEEIRLRYLYRKLILEGKVALSFESAKKIIGPDCAYHLYSAPGLKKKTKKR